MAYYYVRDNGTFIGVATGDAGRSVTARTGIWDATVGNSYASVKAIFANQAVTLNTIVDGDIIIVADDHIESYAVDVSLLIGTATTGATLIIQSCDITNQNTYKRGAQILATAGADIRLFSRTSNRNNAIIKGLIINASGHVDYYARDSSIVFDNSDTINQDTWSLTSTYSIDLSYINSSKLEAFDIRTSSLALNVSGSAVNLRNTSYGIRDSIQTLYFSDSDLTGVLGSSLCAYKASASLYRCKVPAAILDGSWFAPYRSGAEMDLVSCDAGNNYYFNLKASTSGISATNTVTYLNYKYDGVNFACNKMESSDKCGQSSPLRHKLCEIPAQDLSVTDTTYRVNLLLDTTTAASLTDSEFWVELSHNDNTSLALGKIVSSRNIDILATGTTLTTSAEVWQGTLPTNTKAYQIDITLSASELTNVTNGSVVIYVNLAVANTDVYVCPSVQIGT